MLLVQPAAAEKWALFEGPDANILRAHRGKHVCGHVIRVRPYAQLGEVIEISGVREKNVFVPPAADGIARLADSNTFIEWRNWRPRRIRRRRLKSLKSQNGQDETICLRVIEYDRVGRKAIVARRPCRSWWMNIRRFT